MLFVIIPLFILLALGTIFIEIGKELLPLILKWFALPLFLLILLMACLH